MKITLHKGGTAEKTVELESIQIPDLYKISEIPELRRYSLGRRFASDLILECWHLCHAFKNELLELETKRKASIKRKTSGASWAK